jgi:dTDP-4-dehydrorhamnose 3,5-epimerase
VVVDMRKDSPTYKKWDSFTLSAHEYRQVLIPPDFVNGYYVKSEIAIFHYKLAYTGDYLDAGEQMTFRWNDPEFGIKWPCTAPILQERDKL